ncbi:MAG: arsenite methyltransferase [Chloroflexi bacterium]|nr:arsenite methyltransferase [Chloroflexota bacterium]
MESKQKLSPDEIKEGVRRRYAEAVSRSGSCCGPNTVTKQKVQDLVEMIGYSPEELRAIPKDAVEHAFGCGNPLAMAVLEPGQTVLDIGSGAGIDVIMAARRVGPSGKVIGLDMTMEMIMRGKDNARRAGLENVEFRLGDAEDMPVEDSSIDWIISNCVINLAPDKDKVFAEVARVLKPGGQVMISDIVTGELPVEVRSSLEAWAGCLGGAIEEDLYLQKMRDAGLVDVEVVDRVVYDAEAVNSFFNGADCGCCGAGEITSALDAYVDQLAGEVASAKIRARKP